MKTMTLAIKHRVKLNSTNLRLQLNKFSHYIKTYFMEYYVFIWNEK